MIMDVVEQNIHDAAVYASFTPIVVLCLPFDDVWIIYCGVVIIITFVVLPSWCHQCMSNGEKEQ